MANVNFFELMKSNDKIALLIQLYDKQIIDGTQCVDMIDLIINSSVSSPEYANIFAQVNLQLYERELINKIELIERLGLNKISKKDCVQQYANRIDDCFCGEPYLGG